MRFAKNLYIGESIGKNRRLVIWKLQHGAGMLTSYVIALPREGNDPLEIYHNSVLRQRYYHRKPPYVVGIAGSFEEAAFLSWKIISDAMNPEKNYNLWEYFDFDKEDRRAQ